MGQQVQLRHQDLKPSATGSSQNPGPTTNAGITVALDNPITGLSVYNGKVVPADQIPNDKANRKRKREDKKEKGGEEGHRSEE